MMAQKRSAVPASWRRPVYLIVKAFHSAAFLFLQSAVLYLVYKGLRRQSDRPAAIAAAVVGAECAIYAGNGFRCPLTGLAEDLGAESGQVTDIFLPDWLARNIANIYGPLYALGLLLQVRNVVSLRKTSAGQGDQGELSEGRAAHENA